MNAMFLIEDHVFLEDTTKDIVQSLRDEYIEYKVIENGIQEIQSTLNKQVAANLVIPYGSVSFVADLHKLWKDAPCIWYDPDNLSWGAMAAYWGEHLLNREHVITTIGDFKDRQSYFFNLLGKDHQGNNVIFIKPYWNNKCFNAMILVEMAADGTLEQFITDNNYFDRVHRDTLIVLARPKIVQNEWRFFIAGRQIIGSTQYSKNREKHYEDGCPENVSNFAKKVMWGRGIFSHPRVRYNSWQPDWAYSLDICESEDELYVMEVGCLNCSDMYAMNKRSCFRNLVDKIDKKGN